MDKQKTIKATAKFNRNYASNFKTREGQEYKVPYVIFKSHPNHFIVKMVDKEVEKFAKELQIDKGLILSSVPKKETAAEKKTREAQEKSDEEEAAKVAAEEKAVEEAKEEQMAKCKKYEITQKIVHTALNEAKIEVTPENESKMIVELIAKAEAEDGDNK